MTVEAERGLLVEACCRLLEQRRFNDALALVQVEAQLSYAEGQAVVAAALNRSSVSGIAPVLDAQYKARMAFPAPREDVR